MPRHNANPRNQRYPKYLHRTKKSRKWRAYNQLIARAQRQKAWKTLVANVTKEAQRALRRQHPRRGRVYAEEFETW